MNAIILSVLLTTQQYECTKWIWWWDAEYKYKVTQCVEWKKVEKK